MLLFVYGTLKRGQANHHLLHAQRFVGPARTEPGYRLYDLGAYPCLVEDEAGGPVEGELWDVDEGLLPALDELEDAPVLFERWPVRLAGGRSAVVYLYRGPVQGLPACGGRWPY